MKKISSIILAALLVLLSSCVNKEAATNAANQLFDAVKDGNKSKIAAIYPESENLPSYYKSDKIEIKEIKGLKNKEVLVTVGNEYMNGYGKTFTRDIKLYMKPDLNDSKKYIIFDSEGFCGFDPEEDNEYKFALKTGCIDEDVDVTDQQKAAKLQTASLMMFREYLNVMIELRSQITIKNWSWESSYYGDSASGKGICVNNSTFDVPKPKYRVKYYDRSDNLITDDDGYITYDVLRAGTSKAFTFYTSYVGNARSASISVEFDDDMIEKYIADKDYTGNEYAEYIAEKEEKAGDSAAADSTRVQ